MTSTTFGPGVTPAVAAALEARGITSLFPIQQAVVPHASEGRDILARSPTGSGKTIAFGIPLVQALDDDPGIQALVLVPTRELAVQVAAELATLTHHKVQTVFGGVKQGAQVQGMKRAAIVVACPGRLEDLINQRVVDLSEVHTLVLDEADRMLDMGFLKPVERIIAQVSRNRQTMLFSATLDERVTSIANKYTTDAETISTAPVAARPTTVEHAFLPIAHEEKLNLLLDILDEERDLAAVFVRTKRGAARIAKKLEARGVRTAALHGDMLQGRRQRELERFNRGEADVLVATDVFARGLDIERVTMVINYDPPGELDDYVHRSGRTGRAGRDGLCVTFVIPDQREDVQKFADALGLQEEWTRNGLEHIDKQAVKRAAHQQRSSNGRRRPSRAGTRV
ncbi:MAG: DEAD/DEAH box helicase [Thermoleophilia bacterium]|nr:DEAD/DEAH box helicase [Thermoleophilia bacterium]